MGESRRRAMVAGPANGGQTRPARVVHKEVRVVPNIKLQNVEGHTLLMLGEETPEIATALAPAEAKQLAGALLAHAAQVEQAARRIILPGDSGL